VGNLIQRLQRFETNLFLSESTQATLKRVYPHVQFVPKTQGEVRLHDHPILNMEREMAEDYALDYALRLRRSLGATGLVVDVGGNPTRHAREGRKEVHSCNPILDSADVVRSLNHGMSPNTCSHLAEECVCVRVPSVYISIDSIYYLDVDTIARLCLRAETKTLVAVCHEFPDAYGSFADGEAKYQQLTENTVMMQVNGNSHVYKHSNLAWMRANSSPVVDANGVRLGTLCWSRLGGQPYHSVYAFTFTPRLVEASVSAEVSFSSALLDPSHYGPVSMSALNEKGKISVAGDHLSIPDVKVWSWGSFVFVYRTSARIDIMVPKGLVSECAVRCSGLIRSPDNHRTLMAWAKFKAPAYNIPPHMLSSCLFAAATLAFVQDLSFETGILHGLIKPVQGLIDSHEKALGRKFNWVWTGPEVAAALVTLGVSTAGVGTAAHLLGAAIGTVSGLGLAAAGVAAAAAGIAASRFTKSADPFADYRASRASCAPRTAVIPLQRGTQLPATDPVKTKEELDALRMDPSAKAECRDPTATKEPENAPPVRPGNASLLLPAILAKSKGGILHEPVPLTWQQVMPLMPAGIVTSTSIPIVPSNSSMSSYSAIRERIVKCGPFGRGEVNEELWGIFRHWVFQNLPEFGLQPGCVTRMSFSDWNENYSKAQREQHIEALMTVATEDGVLSSRVHDRGLFAKIESLSKSTIDGCVKLAPRGIQSGTAIHNVVTGRFCKSFSRHLSSVWNVNGLGGLMYTSGASAEDIGAAFVRGMDLCPGFGILEGDFARFDSTIHRLFLELEADIYRWSGCSEREFGAFMGCIFTRGQDKWKNKYQVDGGRHSGDHNTSCGNTLLQGLAIMFGLAFHYASTHGGELLSYRQLRDLLHVTMLVLGDDNLLIAPEAFLASLGAEAAGLVELLKLLGLELEPKLHVGPNARFNASFCSARFYPVEGGCVLAPGIGRGLAKSAWYVSPPQNVAVERLLRSDAMSKQRDCWFVPFLGPMWAKNLELSKGFAGQEVFTKEMKRSNLHNAHVVKTHVANDETYRMVEVLYGLTRDDEKQYQKLLDSVKSLPCIVDYDKFHRAMVVDGVSEDRRDEVVVEEEKSYLPTPALSILQGSYSLLTAALSKRFGTSAPITREETKYNVFGSCDEAHAVVAGVWDS
jgi:hypothetical protein